MNIKRLFKIINFNGSSIEDDSIYKATRPNQAALKAFNNHCSKMKIGECNIVFSIKEIGRHYKQYHYNGVRNLSPKVIILDNKPVKLYYSTIITKLKIP